MIARSTTLMPRCRASDDRPAGQAVEEAIRRMPLAAAGQQTADPLGLSR
jgi:hypothetical protein